MTPYQFGVKIGVKMAAAPQAMSMNDNGAPQGGTIGQQLSEHVGLADKLVAQGKAKYPVSSPVTPRVFAAGVRNNPAAPPLQNNPPLGNISSGAPDYYPNRRAALRLVSPVSGAASDAWSMGQRLVNSGPRHNHDMSNAGPISADGGVYVQNPADPNNTPVFRSHADVARLGMPNLPAINAVNGVPNTKTPPTKPSLMKTLFGNGLHPAERF